MFVCRASGHQVFDVDRPRLMGGRTFGFAGDGKAGDAVEIVFRHLAGAADQKVLLLVHEVLPVIFAELEIRRELDRTGRAGFLAQAAEDAAREVDAEKFGIPAAIRLLALLQRDAPDRAGRRAEVAGYAAFLAVRVPRKDDAAAIARGQIGLHLWIEDRIALARAVREDHRESSQVREDALENAEHG